MTLNDHRPPRTYGAVQASAINISGGMANLSRLADTGRVRPLPWIAMTLLAGCTLPAPNVHGEYDPSKGGVYFPITVRLHTDPPYAIAIVDDIQKFGANGTLRLDPAVPHRVEIQRTGYYGQVIHFEPNPDYLRPMPSSNDEAPRSPIAFHTKLEDLASGETTDIEYADVRINLEALRAPAKSARLADDPDTIVAVMPTIADARSQKLFDASLFDALTDQLRVGLGARRVPVIDRGRLAAKLAETIRGEKAASYRACVDEACQIPLGKALAATHLLRSTLAHSGDRCALALELIDLQSELTIDAAAASTACEGTSPLDTAEHLTERMFPSESH